MLTRPTASTIIITNRIAPMANCIDLVRGRDGRDRDGELARSLCAIGLNPHLPGARRHHPERAGEELRVELSIAASRSGVGANLAPAPVSGIGVTRSSRMSGDERADFDFGDVRESPRAGGR